jgi:hypothetical protein
MDDAGMCPEANEVEIEIRAPIEKATLLMQLGNISQRTGRMLNIDSKNGHILNDPEATKLWSREYEKGWEMTL